ncbi:MAG: class I SAM-dependent methyltransferase [Candidatus Brocadiaceae bacterium]|nr:class I SAM-dependent methyltransferase [Candidatus Brocadiaceae bacterium]
MNNNIFARNEDSRVVYYNISPPPGSNLWDQHWEETSKSVSEIYSRYENGHLGYGLLRHVFLKYLPKGGRILEAGCGLGQFVLALRARGYNCMGIDFAFQTIQNLKKHFPDITVMVGDICHLNLKDECLDAYISLGVVEHFREGPVVPLREAFRVLKEGGTLIVSVPQAFQWRRLDANSENTPLPDKAAFYQYAFLPDEFREFLKIAGFTIKAEYGCSLHYAFRLRFKAFRKLLARFPKLSYIDFLTDRLQLGPDNSRMRLYIATKEHGG